MIHSDKGIDHYDQVVRMTAKKVDEVLKQQGRTSITFGELREIRKSILMEETPRLKL